ncbi:MAG: hypothetical protein SPI65_07455 [Peptoniphilus sp.]|nr:hypothetical protein [Peptoniphilus sp.]MDD7363297.1 hypothetical protein [Bacillota bacterium]MDY6045392.1 hypothetical protein [Peptoniphilus sp.]
MNKALKKMHIYTFAVGILVLAVSFILPAGGETALKPVGAATVFICPALGIVGMVFSLINKKYFYLILNALLVFSFFVVMAVGYSLLGP